METDQLRKEIHERRAFLGFSEGDITFPPTFKVCQGPGASRPRWVQRAT
jgi:hypothetical protein